MSEEWYKSIDFSRNPFRLRTRAFGSDTLLEEIFYTILSGNIMVIEGQKGMGKTKVLKEARRKFKRKGKVIYVGSGKIGEGLNIESILKDKRNWLEKLFNLKPKNMVLLLDDIEHLSARNSERIKYYYDQNYIRSIVFSTKNFGSLSLSPSLVHRISRIISMKPLSDYEAVQLLRAKIGDKLLSDRIVKKIFHLSGKNTLLFLKNCEEVCKLTVNNTQITEDTVGRLLAK
ncbi:MAG: ATP-binding protein [Candidatus Woesearchaeota archaeon]